MGKYNLLKENCSERLDFFYTIPKYLHTPDLPVSSFSASKSVSTFCKYCNAFLSFEIRTYEKPKVRKPLAVPSVWFVRLASVTASLLNSYAAAESLTRLSHVSALSVSIFCY